MASPLPSDNEVLADKWVKSKNDMWNILCKIKSYVSKILAENIALKKDVEELKSSLQISDTQTASLKQTVDNISTTVKKYDKELKDHENYISQVEDRVYDLELNLDSLEQYTRKYNMEIHGIAKKREENLKDGTGKISKFPGTISIGFYLFFTWIFFVIQTWKKCNFSRFGFLFVFSNIQNRKITENQTWY